MEQNQILDEIPTAARIAEFQKILADNIRPEKRLTVSQYADEKRYLPPEGSAEPGRWRTARFPFLRRIMDLLSVQDSTQEVTVMKGAQLGFTEAAINFIFYKIEHAPAPMMYMQKTVDAVEKFSKQRLDKSIAGMPSVVDRVGERKSKTSENTILIKTFPGGVLILGGANSAASLRSMPIEALIRDEEDSYDSDIDHEGDPSTLAERRTSNFPHRKIFSLSTPGIKETSKIEPRFNSGSREYYHVPCPFCGKLQPIFLAQLKCVNHDPETVKLECRFCKELIAERYKTQMLKECENYDDPDAPGARWIAEDPENKHKSFHISSLYSPLGFFSWVDAMRMYFKATESFDKALLQVFINTVLGETWTVAGKEIEAAWVMKRKEVYPAPVPQRGLILTIGADVQEDRIEAETVAWGQGEESWSVDYSVFMGDTELSDVWQQFDSYTMRQWRHESGVFLLPLVTAVDSGHRAEVVYRFCLDREPRRIFPIKGDGGFGRGYIRRPQTRNAAGVWLFQVFVDEIKSQIYSRLQIQQKPTDLFTPGYCHFPARPEYNEQHFRNLTAERLVTVKRAGRTSLAWELPKGRRNEPLDCRCYAYAALCILNPQWSTYTRPLVLSQNQAPTKKKYRRITSRNIA